MNNFTIYHNPRCSKSRQTLELIKANGIDPSIVLYLEEPPTTETLSNIIDLLKLKPGTCLEKVRTNIKP